MTERRLVIMRHAKSSWKSNVSSDHARPLNERGQRDAPRVAARLADLGWAPQLIISSDSTRTRETYAGMAPAFEEPQVLFTEEFYLAGIEEIREQVAMVPTEITRVLVLGHNPGWEDAVGWWSSRATTMKTACAALLEGAGSDWSQALEAPGTWKLISVIRPKELDD